MLTYLHANPEKYENIFNLRERNNFNWQNRVVCCGLLNHIELKALCSTHGLYIELFRFNIELFGQRLTDKVHSIYVHEFIQDKILFNLCHAPVANVHALLRTGTLRVVFSRLYTYIEVRNSYNSASKTVFTK